MKADETYVDEFGETIDQPDQDQLRSIKTPLREDKDEYGFRERLDNPNDPKYDEAITEAVRAEEVRILDDELAEQADSEYIRQE